MLESVWLLHDAFVEAPRQLRIKALTLRGERYFAQRSLCDIWRERRFEKRKNRDATALMKTKEACPPGASLTEIYHLKFTSLASALLEMEP